MDAPVRHHLCSVDKQTCQSVHEQDSSQGDPGPGLCTDLGPTVSQVITGNRSIDPFWGGATTDFPLIYACGDGVRRSWQCSALLHEEWRESLMTLSASPFLSPAGIQMHQEERTQEAWNVPRTKGAVRQYVVGATSNTSGDCGVPRGLAPAGSWNMSRRVKQLR